MSSKLIIKKYKNRKYYSYTTSGYVSLSDILNLNSKNDIQVLDANDKDITALSLIQAIALNIEANYPNITLKGLNIIKKKVNELQKELK